MAARAEAAADLGSAEAPWKEGDEAGAVKRSPGPDLSSEISEVGERLARRRLSRHAIGRLHHERGMALVGRNSRLRNALFQLVDVAPACREPIELAEHLDSFLGELGEDGGPAIGVTRRLARGPRSGSLIGWIARLAINQMAHRFIAGATLNHAADELGRQWSRGSATSVDLLGEATLTNAEGAAYAERCARVLVELAATASRWPANPLLERDSAGALPRANLSVKVTALTPLIRPAAPQRGRGDATRHLRHLLRRADEVGAHLHVDMESMDSLETVLELVLDLLAEDEFRTGPSVGLVLQAYLRDSEQILDQVLDWTDRIPREHPLSVRLVKGAYWDQERIEALQHGWTPPVWDQKADSDRCFERLTRRLIDRFPSVRPAIASHNIRSLAHAVAYARYRGLETGDLELQVLRGLGDALAEAIAREGFRGRVYCPVGDLVSGMAYLVRRLLENSSNDSFLADRAAGADLDALLARP